MITPLESAREAASGIDPAAAARRCGFGYEGSRREGTFSATFLGRAVELSFPSFSAVFAHASDAVPDDVRALLAYYLATSDGAEPAGKWISFADLPDGRFYCSTWRGYTGRVLVARFGNDLGAVRAAAEALGGRPVRITADIAYAFDVLPKVPVALLYWSGDEEFEPRADFLFDETAGRHLTTDACAVVCKWLTDALVER